MFTTSIDVLRDPAAFLRAEGFPAAEAVVLPGGVTGWRVSAQKRWALENCVIRARRSVHEAGGALLIQFDEAAPEPVDALWLFPEQQPVELFPVLRAIGYLEGGPVDRVAATEAIYRELCTEKPCLTPTRLSRRFVNLRCLDGQIPSALARRALNFSCAVHGYLVDGEVFDGAEAEAHYWATKGSLVLGG
ncbi:MAG: hypothetical protein ACFB20_00860 [Opitutales bacterium]